MAARPIQRAAKGCGAAPAIEINEVDARREAAQLHLAVFVGLLRAAVCRAASIASRHNGTWQGSSLSNRARERWPSAPNHHFLLHCTPYRRSRSPSFGRPCCSQLQPDVLMTPALKWTGSEVGRHF